MKREDQIKKAAEIIAYGCSDELKAALIKDFPELAELKDERMVRIIEDVICTKEGEVIAQKYGLKLTDLADWLERQKEQKPSIKEPKYESFEDGNATGWRIKQQPAEWSEEDDVMIGNIFGTYKTLEDMLDLSTGQDRDILESMNFEKDWLKDRFKSLRPQPHWKPSEEQIKALKVVARGFPADDPGVIDSLLADLQKLL